MMKEDSLFDVLPGVRMPVDEVTAELQRMWDQPVESRSEASMAYRASQMSLILHFGLRTDVGAAHERFSQALRFAQKYPCRIVVLTPRHYRDSGDLLEGKLFSQCYIGANHRERCCCEALILGYYTTESRLLENQVSIWLESDLPVYYWVHGVPAAAIEANYLSFAQRCQRVVFDSDVEGEAIRGIDWPEKVMLRDLAFARTLPVRQSLGTFLSGFAPGELVEDLEEIRVIYGDEKRGEGRNVLEWLQNCTRLACLEAGCEAERVRYTLVAGAPHEECALCVSWKYSSGEKHFRWDHHGSQPRAHVDARLGGREIRYPFQVRIMAEDEALAEALFFGG